MSKYLKGPMMAQARKLLPMSESLRNWLFLVLALLLVALAAWTFSGPSPELCMDGECHQVF